MAKKAAKKIVSKRKAAKKTANRGIPQAVKTAPAKLARISRWHAAPLKGSFMVTAILGFILSYYYVFPVSYNFGIACMIIFAVMFFASVVSMTKSPVQID